MGILDDELDLDIVQEKNPKPNPDGTPYGFTQVVQEEETRKAEKKNPVVFSMSDILNEINVPVDLQAFFDTQLSSRIPSKIENKINLFSDDIEGIRHHLLSSNPILIPEQVEIYFSNEERDLSKETLNLLSNPFSNLTSLLDSFPLKFTSDINLKIEMLEHRKFILQTYSNELKDKDLDSELYLLDFHMSKLSDFSDLVQDIKHILEKFFDIY